MSLGTLAVSGAFKSCRYCQGLFNHGRSVTIEVDGLRYPFCSADCARASRGWSG